MWDADLRQFGINLAGVGKFGDLMMLIDVIDGSTDIRIGKLYSIPYDPKTKQFAGEDKIANRATQYQGREQQFQKLADHYSNQIDNLKKIALPYALRIEPLNPKTHSSDSQWQSNLSQVSQAYDDWKNLRNTPP